MRFWWAFALGLLLATPAFAQAKTLSELERDLISLHEFRSIITEKMDGQRKTMRRIAERLSELRSSRMVEALYKSEIEALELQKTSLENSLDTHAKLVENYDKQIAGTQEKIAALQEEQRRKDDQAALEARMAAEHAARLEAERIAEERRIAREQAQEQRQWKLLYLVGGVTVLLFGVFIALRAVGVSASLSEWGRFYFWLVKAAVVVSFALFLLTAVETVFGALSIPDWMRRPLADLLDKASDAIDPEAQGAPK